MALGDPSAQAAGPPNPIWSGVHGRMVVGRGSFCGRSFSPQPDGHISASVIAQKETQSPQTMHTPHLVYVCVCAAACGWPAVCSQRESAAAKGESIGRHGKQVPPKKGGGREEGAMKTMQCVQCAVAAVCGCALLLAHQHQRPCPASISGLTACMACPQQGAAATRWCNCKSIASAMATVQCTQGGKVSRDEVQGQQGQGASSQSAPADAAGTRSASWPRLPRPTGSSATCGKQKVGELEPNGSSGRWR